MWVFLIYRHAVWSWGSCSGREGNRIFCFKTSELRSWLIDMLTNWLACWLIGWLNDWLVDWLIDSSLDWLTWVLIFISRFKVCQLRERRLDLEEELAEEKKTSESLKKESDALVKKAKIIDGALKTAEADLEAFQVSRMNEM